MNPTISPARFPCAWLTPRLRVREQVLADADAANAYEARAEVMRWTPHHPRTHAESAAVIAKTLAEQAARPRRIFDLAIEPRAGGPMIGRVGMAVEDDLGHNAAFWYVLHPEHQGQGLATEAARSFLAFAFGEMRIHRVYADIDPRNTPSVALVERLGFRREAHFRRNVYLKGEWCDTLIYALLAEEWAGAAR